MSSSQSSGYICSPDELSFARLNPSSFVCLTRGESIGIALLVFASFMSIVAASAVLFLILVSLDDFLVLLDAQFVILASSVQEGVFESNADASSERIYNIQSEYITDAGSQTSLFVNELLVGVSNALSLKWVIAGKLSTGGYCTTQGASECFRTFNRT
jgi:hypothetical protein